MEIRKTSIEGLALIKPKVYNDERGYFMESYKESFINENFPNIHFIQGNESKSSFGVLRGLHLQLNPYSQTKLVRVVEGEIYDVAVDLRPKSQSYGKWESFILSSDNKKQLLIPKGFAHGFICLSEIAIINYKVDNIYSKDHERTLLYNDPSLNIKWPIENKNLIVSQKDMNGVSLNDLKI
jgi:dTDP-4-dehydrorhamnose 3,5-epimerase